MVYETRYRVITIDRDNGDKLVYALLPDGRIIPLHQRNEDATAALPQTTCEILTTRAALASSARRQTHSFAMRCRAQPNDAR